MTRYADLVHALEEEPGRVSEVQDYLGQRQAQRSMTSKDGEATYLVLGLRFRGRCPGLR